MSPGQAPCIRHEFPGLPHRNYTTTISLCPKPLLAQINCQSLLILFCLPNPSSCSCPPSPLVTASHEVLVEGRGVSDDSRLRQRDNWCLCSCKIYFRLLYPLLRVTLAKAVCPGGIAQNVMLPDVGPCPFWLWGDLSTSSTMKSWSWAGESCICPFHTFQFKKEFVCVLGLVPKTRSHRKQLEFP